MTEAATVPVLIDTDIGDDADDALALGFALSCANLELLGVTTVFGNTVLRAHMTRYLLDLADRPDIPVHAGAPENDAIPCQFDDRMRSALPDGDDAVQFLADTLSERSATLICIGPLTNIAALLSRHPERTANIQEIVLMGGCYYRHATEWNMTCDPKAADLVFRSGVPLRALGLDVTARCALDRATLDSLPREQPMHQFLVEMCERWYRHSGYLPVLHDPLTVHATAAQDDLIRYKDERVHLELEGTYTRGMTFVEPHRIWGREAPDPNVRVASHVEAEAFKRLFIRQVFGDPDQDVAG